NSSSPAKAFSIYADTAWNIGNGYRNYRAIPSVMATLHLICGKAASGKTTLGRELAARHAAVLFGEDEWMALLDAEINSLADHVRHSKRLKAALAPLAVRLLRLGVPIVFDFAGNTPNDRAWVRSLFESANADHVLHYIIASDEACKAR